MMTARDHNAEFEQLMACLDGALVPAEAERVRAHLDGCAECQRMEAEMRGVSARLAGWTVPEAPASLRWPQPRGGLWIPARWMPLAASLVFAVGVVLIWMAGERPQPRGAEAGVAAQLTDSGAPAEEAGAQPAPGSVATLRQQERSGPLVVRTARLSLVPRDFDGARVEMERIVTTAGGFTGHIQVSEPRGGVRSLSATLRIPTARLDETLGALKRLGQLTSESQDGEDVTQQSVDLNARLQNARASEKRLQDILGRRTGDLADVLAVEREIARVRGEIEQMEAQRTSLDRRITYATVSIEMSEERRAAMNLGPLPVSTRLRNALVDGWTVALNSGIEAAVVIARVAPVLTLWLLVLAVPGWLVRRRLAR